MAAKKKSSSRTAEAEATLANLTKPTVVTPDNKHTGTIAARHKAEAERVAAANKLKAELIAEARA